MFSLTIYSGHGLLRAAFLSVGEVVSSLGEIYHSAELSNLILSPLSMAKVTYLKIDTNVVFLEL